MLNMSYEEKIIHTRIRIKEFYNYYDGDVAINYSGGIDSTVLLDLVRNIFPEVKAIFVDTGLEFPSLKEQVNKTENVEIYRPKMNFRQVLKKYGYPIISKEVARFLSDLRRKNKNNINTRRLRLTGITQKGEYQRNMQLPQKWLDKFIRIHDLENLDYEYIAPFKVSHKCCKVMKEKPFNKIDNNVYIGIRAEEGYRRYRNYVQHGCNTYGEKPKSRPLSIWNKQDILKYLVQHNLDYPEVYGEIISTGNKYYLTGEQRTGCVFCGFGIHLENEPNRIQRLEKINPKLYNYVLNDLGFKEVYEFMGIPYKNNKMTIDDFV